jgi:hypothetical protein
MKQANHQGSGSRRKDSPQRCPGQIVEWIGLILSEHRGYSLPLVKVLPNSDSFQKVNEVLWHFL